MTITPTAPSITPCPVSWCQEARAHDWREMVGLDRERLHTRDVLVTPLGVGGRDIVVTAEVYETPTGNEALLDLENAEQLFSREQVEQVIAALREAAILAFGPSPVAAAEEELDAAIAEVITRAGHPEDVNRLVAASVRLRTAHAALVEADVAAVTR